MSVLVRLEHFLLTRFNLFEFGDLGLDAGWLRHRMGLFRSFCAPSVLAQSCSAFRWLIFVEPGTPDEARRELDQVVAPIGTVCVAAGPAARCAGEVVRRALAPSTTHVLTTTLDNDDAIAKDFVALVQGAVRPAPFEIVNLRRGLRLVVSSGRLYECELSTNPFASLLTERETSAIVWDCLPHSTMSQRFRRIRNVDTDPAWLQVVHDRNLAGTGVWGLKRVRRDLSRFELAWRAPAADGGIHIENVRRRMERRMMRLVPLAMRARLRGMLANRVP